jgi:sn-glycerol 3-phosphate transport system substrate-binding protein
VEVGVGVQGFRAMNLHRMTRIAMGTAIAASLSVISLVAGLGAAPASAGTNCSPSSLPKGTTNITYWEGMTAANETAMVSLTNKFNASQSKVHVTLVQQTGGYVQTWDDYLSSLGTSNEPNVVMLDQYITQGAVDSKSITPIATCVAGTHYSTTPFAKKAILEETSAGKLQGLPYSVSAPILIYNQKAFAKAKIKSAPTTIALMGKDAALLKRAKYADGMTLAIDPWYLQVWEGVNNSDFVNNNNGRTGRATAAAFNNPTGKTILTDLQHIVKSGDAVTNPDTGSIQTAYANLYAIGFNKSGMTIDSSATLGTILSLLHEFPNVKLGVAPMPKVSAGVAGGVQPGGNALFLPTYSNSSAAKMAASWEFIQYLDSAKDMATWDAATGYVPIRTDAAATSTMKAYWKKYPPLKAAYVEIEQGKVDDATAGPLLGDYYTVNDDLTTSEDQLLGASFPSPASVLSSAASKVTSDIQAYNSSL